MKTAFRSLNTDDRHVRVVFDGQDLSLPDGENLAASLLAAGIHRFRETPASGAPRAPYCMMGACYDCLVEIDGIVRQACLVTVQEGMTIRKPHEPQDA